MHIDERNDRIQRMLNYGSTRAAFVKIHMSPSVNARVLNRKLKGKYLANLPFLFFF
jgi:hypothetical protein